MSTIVFLGGGRITSALLAGLAAARFPHRIVVHDRNARKMKALRTQFGITISPGVADALSRADLLVLAVRPQSLPELLPTLRSARSLPAVSVAAAVPVATLRSLSPAPLRWARAMPSPACRTSRGLTAMHFPAAYPSAARKLAIDIFSSVGEVVQVPEKEFDAFTVLYSTSHGQHLLHVLAAEGRRLGLGERLALTAASHALADGVQLWRQNRSSLHRELREAATPGGIAAAVMQSMDDSGLAQTIEAGLRAGLARCRELAQQVGKSSRRGRR